MTKNNMPIPFEVSYQTVGKKKTRNVIGVICPTALSQSMGFFYYKPIFINMGDIKVDWDKTSPGFEVLKENGLLK
jgi:hypothetical protein